MQYIYPAIIHEDSDGLWAEFPDLPMQSIPREEHSYPTLIRTNINLAKANRSVKKTLTIPAWLNDRARAEGINFSKTLHDALLEKIG